MCGVQFIGIEPQKTKKRAQANLLRTEYELSHERYLREMKDHWATSVRITDELDLLW